MKQSYSSAIKIARWSARVISIAMVIFISLAALAEPPNPIQLSAVENLLLAFFLVMVAGMVTAWWHEKVGGWLLIAGFVAFTSADFASSGTLLRAWPIFAFPVLGITYLLCSNKFKK